MANSRTVVLQLSYNNTNLTKDIAPFLMSFSYTDNASGQADDISIQLEDRDRRFSKSDLFIKKGTVVTANLAVKDWIPGKQDVALPCGTFSVDDIDIQGPPETVTFKGVSVPIDGAIRLEKRSKAWEKCNLQTIAQQIASTAGLTLYYDAPINPIWKRKDQSEESDLEFLQKLVEDAGMCLKVTANQVVIFDASTYEKKPAVLKIVRGTSDIISYNFNSKSEGVYNACHLKYYNTSKKTTIEYTYNATDTTGVKRTLEINERVENLAEAETLTRKKLRETNKGQVTGRLTLIGNPALVAAVNIEVSGWGEFDGKYTVDKATHSVSGSYTTSIDMYKTLEGY